VIVSLMYFLRCRYVRKVSGPVSLSASSSLLQAMHRESLAMEADVCIEYD
jgi:hypothetical protein